MFTAYVQLGYLVRTSNVSSKFDTKRTFTVTSVKIPRASNITEWTGFGFIQWHAAVTRGGRIVAVGAGRGIASARP